jgi:hypothetical protein
MGHPLRNRDRTFYTILFTRPLVIPLAMQHYMLLQRNLIYTGITRGKKVVVLIGQKKALGIAVHNDRPQRRYSGLLASLRCHERHSPAASSLTTPGSE